MEVYLDDEPFHPQTHPQTTVGDVIEQAKTRLPSEQRMLVAIRCDGQEVPSERLEDVLASPIDAYAKVELATTSRQQLAIDALEGAAALFGETSGMTGDVVELLSQGQTARAMKLLGECLEAWNQAGDTVRRTAQLLSLDLDTMQVEQQPLPELFGVLREQLNGIKEAIEGRDYVLLADILQYELPQTAQQWERMIRAVRDRVGQARSSP
jgi:hypothetical protein